MLQAIIFRECRMRGFTIFILIIVVATLLLGIYMYVAQKDFLFFCVAFVLSALTLLLLIVLRRVEKNVQ
ncbi:hypothetical protein ACFL29_01185 [Patescibacteria group bacterium]